jgi:hypothetical protein
MRISLRGLEVGGQLRLREPRRSKKQGAEVGALRALSPACSEVPVTPFVTPI